MTMDNTHQAESQVQVTAWPHKPWESWLCISVPQKEWPPVPSLLPQATPPALGGRTMTTRIPSRKHAVAEYKEELVIAKQREMRRSIQSHGEWKGAATHCHHFVSACPWAIYQAGRKTYFLPLCYALRGRNAIIFTSKFSVYGSGIASFLK